MEKMISATEIVRDFSTILNKVKFARDHFIVYRNGKPMARISPVDEEESPHLLVNLKILLDQLPRLDDELDSFYDDLKIICDEQPEIPEESNWA